MMIILRTTILMMPPEQYELEDHIHTAADGGTISYDVLTDKPTTHSELAGGDDEDAHHDREHDSSDHSDNYSAEDHTHDTSASIDSSTEILTINTGGTSNTVDALSGFAEDGHTHDATEQYELEDHAHTADAGGIISYDELRDHPNHRDLDGSDDVDAHHDEIHDHSSDPTRW